MSRVSIKASKPDSPERIKKHQEDNASTLFGFCCSTDNVDSLAKYNELTTQCKHLQKSRYKIHESPTLKFRTHSTGLLDDEPGKRHSRYRSFVDTGNYRSRSYMRNFHNLKNPRFKGNNSFGRFENVFVAEDLHDENVKHVLEGPLKWYLEDEVATGKSTLWEKRQKAYNDEMDKNTLAGKKKIQFTTKGEMDMCPRWYQDFSLEQMKNLKMLECIMHKDYKQMVTGRTHRTLAMIGIVSTFFTLAPDVIRRLQEFSHCNVVHFLREVYKILTGNYFEEEGYRKSYDCNQRIILSAIAFLTLPEAAMELHKRLPPVKMPKLQPKPTPPSPPIRPRMSSPYEEDLFVRPDWASYLNALQRWQEQRQLIPVPTLILPSKDCIISSFETTESSTNNREARTSKLQSNQPTINQQQNNQPTRNSFLARARKKRSVSVERRQENTSVDVEQKTKNNITEDATSGATVPINRRRSSSSRRKDDKENTDTEDLDRGEEKLEDNGAHHIGTEQRLEKYDPQKSAKLDVPPLYGENTLFDFTINGICEKPGPVEYKICGVLKPPKPNRKSWIDEKHAHYIIAGASDNPPTCPVTYEMTGVANVTPSNSDERFFSVLKLGDGPNKIYPSGRKHLSRHWQEWLQNVDEEFRKVEREANKMIKNIEAITKLVFPGPTCDSCCSCRQTRKSYLKAKETKAPYFVIDTIAEDDNRNKYIVGSMAMHSPAPTPPESTVNLLEVIASEDVLTSNLIINGVTTEKGDMQYFITGSKKETIHVPARVVEHPPPRPPRNVPPCVCAIQQVFSKGLDTKLSLDNIPWTKQDGLCFGNKFRPQESPAYSCKMYPGDKSCRKSPFVHEIMKLKRKAERDKKKELKSDPEKEKRMYSIADFQPCGDEHGMSICGGPWGAVHTLTPEELAEQERLRKEILRGPPCGTKPGRAVCKGPFGERVAKTGMASFLKEEILGDEEELEEEEEEEDEEGKEKEEEKKPPVKEKEKKRGKGCHMSPEAIADRKVIRQEKTRKKFIPDPDYPGYDDPWNVFRTAPTEKESETDFKTLLKLSSPKQPSTPVQSKLMVVADDKRPLEGNASVAKIDTKKSSSKVNGDGSKRKAPGKSVSKLSAKKAVSEKLKRTEKASKSKLRSVDQKETQSSLKEKPYNKPAMSEITLRRAESKISKAAKSTRDLVVTDEKARVPNRQSERKTREPKNGSPGIGKKISPPRGKGNKKSGPKQHALSGIDNSKADRTSARNESKKLDPNSSTSVKKKKVSKHTLARNKSVKRDRKKDVNIVQEEDSEITQRNKIQQLKNMMKSSNVYPYDVKAADMPQDPPGKCKRQDNEIEAEEAATDAEEHAEEQLTSKGPCGWRTKSEQQLPTKKTLVYLTDPVYPPETVPVRPGGKPCSCRENRAKKKILLYNIGGLLGKKKDDEDTKLLKRKKVQDKKMQVIDGVIYYTPPPSPRRSDEYVPEYDLCESPYDMCVTKRKDANLMYLDRYSRTKSTGPVDREPCGCNQYIDTYGMETTAEDEEQAETAKELEKTKERLLNEKPPKERWKLALKDVELNDYFTRCRDSMPCWLKCVKFNKIGCSVPRSRLKTRRPVCECKYERKVLEHKEEKQKWKERQKRLKSLKKEPFVNVADISKPLVPNTKLMISNVKRIPQDDEYVDDIKYCISGVAENYSHLPPKQVVGGVHMATPIHTPEPSQEEIPCVCLHQHWSPTNIPPGPLPRPREIMLAQKRRRQEALKEAYRQIYDPLPVYHTHEDHSCKETCNLNSGIESSEALADSAEGVTKHEAGAALLLKMSGDKDNLVGIPQKTKRNTRANTDGTQSRAEAKSVQSKKTSDIKDRISQRDYKESRDDTYSSSDAAKQYVETMDNTSKVGKEARASAKRISILTTVKTELKKMAAEGFIFAKLPQAFLMPQLRYWLMYRSGIALSTADKYNSVRKSIVMWNTLDVATARSKIEPEPLKISKARLNKMTFDNAAEMKEKIAMKNAVFFSEVRKKRVLYSRSMWNTMEYGKFPSVSFKQAYFTYMAGKEADGHVFKPWLPSEVREMR